MTTATRPTPLEHADLPFLDTDDDAYAQDPWACVSALRASTDGPVHLAKSPRGVEALSYPLVHAVFRDARLRPPRVDYYEAKGALPAAVEFIDDGKLPHMPRDKHLRIRRIMAAAFRASAIEDRSDDFARLASELVDGFARRGSCDLVADFTHRFSIEVLCSMIGVPREHIDQFDRATLDLALIHMTPLEPHAERLQAALDTLRGYCGELLEQRRREPQQDFLSALISVQEQEGKLSDSETIWGVANLLYAGHDTTRFQLGSCIVALLRAGAWEMLRERPELIPAVVDEGMRYHPVTIRIARVVAEDGVELDGVELPAGTVVNINMCGAGRDPEAFEQPDEFRLDRDASDRIGFGHGLHKCLGHLLARREMEVALQVLVDRLPDLRIAGEVEVAPARGALWGPTSVPASFTAA